jgi:hypothetical protein
MLFSLKYLTTSILELTGHDYFHTGTFSCNTTGWLGEVFGAGSTYWNAVISFNLAFMVKAPTLYAQYTKKSCLLCGCFIFAWGIPLTIATGTYVSGNVVRDTDFSCWVTPFWRMETYAGVLVCFVWTALVQVYTACRLKFSQSYEVHVLSVLTLLNYFVWLWPVVNTFGEHSGLLKHSIGLANTISIGSIGFVNALVGSVLSFRLFSRDSFLADRMEPLLGHLLNHESSVESTTEPSSTGRNLFETTETVSETMVLVDFSQSNSFSSQYSSTSEDGLLN